MQIGMSPPDTRVAAHRSFALRTLGAVACVGLVLCVAGAVWSETLSGDTVQLHEGEVTLTEGDLIRAIETGVFHIPFVKDPVESFPGMSQALVPCTTVTMS